MRPYLIPFFFLISICFIGAKQKAFGVVPTDLAPVLEPVRNHYHLPALAAAVIRDGQLCALGAAGIRKAGDETPVTAHDQFHLGSCTKAMTATLIGMLIERGKLRWDTTLAEAFPEMADAMQPEYRNVTLEHLLAHRAGLPGAEQSWPTGKTFMDMHTLPGSPMHQRLEYTRLILSQPPVAQPGTQYLYSNAGYAIAGAMAEQVMNKPWETLMQEMLFEPLGMKTPGFGAMGSAGKIDQPWQHKTIWGMHFPVEPGPFSDNPPVIGPGGTVHCSMEDWARFIILHLKGEKEDTELLKKETVQKLHTPAFEGDYVGGWQITSRTWADGRVLTHAGSNTMNFAVVWMAPNRDFAVLVASNQGGGRVEKACDETAGMLIRQFLPDAE